jgi:type VI secretion system protein ImpM
MSIARASVGFFGKLPCNGDFLQRRVPQPFLDVWDPWLQDCLHTSRRIGGETWLEGYLTSPLWRFVLAEGACGSGAYAGIVAPSVDRVGRYFPLTIVAQIDVDLCPLDVASACRGWFEAVEDLVVAAMEEPNVDLAWFDSNLEALAPFLDESVPESLPQLRELLERSHFPAQGAAWRTPLSGASGLQNAINAYAYRELSRELRPLSCWWTQGSAATAPSWLCVRGLPPPQSFGALLGGRWSEAGWSDLGELGLWRAAPAPAPTLVARPLAVQPVQDAGAAAPAPLTARATLPDVQATAIELNKAAFVLRPEVGLWGVAAAPDPAGHPAALELIAAALQQIAPASSLTLLVESVRAALTEVHRQLRLFAGRDVQRIDSSANVEVLLIAGAESAVVAAGAVQLFRVRARQLESRGGADGGVAVGAGAGPNSLLELVGASGPADTPLGAAGFRDLHVGYERICRDDQWILCARRVLTSAHQGRLAATAASGLVVDARVIGDVVDPLGLAPAALPVLSLELGE